MRIHRAVARMETDRQTDTDRQTERALTWSATSVAFSGAFVKLRKTTISFVMSVCLSVCPQATTGLQMDGWSWNLIYQYFSKNLSRKFRF